MKANLQREFIPRPSVAPGFFWGDETAFCSNCFWRHSEEQLHMSHCDVHVGLLALREKEEMPMMMAAAQVSGPNFHPNLNMPPLGWNALRPNMTQFVRCRHAQNSSISPWALCICSCTACGRQVLEWHSGLFHICSIAATPLQSVQSVNVLLCLYWAYFADVVRVDFMGSSIPGPSHGICSYLLGRRMPLREIESSDVTNLLKKDAPHTIFTYVLPTNALAGHKEFLPQGVLGGALNQAERQFWGCTVIPHSWNETMFPQNVKKSHGHVHIGLKLNRDLFQGNQRQNMFWGPATYVFSLKVTTQEANANGCSLCFFVPNKSV